MKFPLPHAKQNTEDHLTAVAPRHAIYRVFIAYQVRKFLLLHAKQIPEDQLTAAASRHIKFIYRFQCHEDTVCVVYKSSAAP